MISLTLLRLLLLIFATSSLISGLHVVEKNNDIILFHAIGDTVEAEVEAILNIIQAAQHFKKFDNEYWTSAQRRVYASSDACQDLSGQVKNSLRLSFGIELHCFVVKRAADTRIGVRKPSMEHVTEVLYALEHTFSVPEMATLNGRVLYLAYSDTTAVFPTPGFLPRWRSSNFREADAQTRANWSPETARAMGVKAQYDILLLGKNKGFTSVSDWHDLQTIVFKVNKQSLSGLRQWLEVFGEAYRDYAHRAAYNMLEPRPALVEASLQTRTSLRVRYWSEQQIVAVKTLTSTTVAESDGAMLRLVCNTRGHMLRRFDNSDEDYDVNVCFAVHYESSLHYRRRIDLATPSAVGMLVEVKEDEVATRLPWGMEYGSLRYRLGDASTGTPKPYCFARSRSGRSPAYERPPKARIYDNFDKSRPYHEGPELPPLSPSTGRVVVMSGVLGSTIPASLYVHLHKQYYAKRHGYKFLLQLSDKFVQYFPRALWQAYENKDATKPEEEFYNHREDSYFEGVMSKALMALDAMCTYSQEYPEGSGRAAGEWIFFTDGDVHINAEWLHMPLERFLDDIPEDKVFVHTNYRSMMTGAFFIRNNEKGRRLVRDWLAIVMSGYVTCHAYDQSALQILMLLRQFPEQPYEVNLGNFSALNKEFSQYEVRADDRGVNGRSVERLSDSEKKQIRAARPHGCNPDAFDFSADYKFEKALMGMGFKGDFKGFWGDLYSSYSMGCANSFIRDFHVVAESPSRPRLQCFHCSNLLELGSSVWDGHIGGSNERVRAGSINSYFTNHKALFLFHEQFLDEDSCAEVKYLEPCESQYASVAAQRQDPVASSADDRAGEYLRQMPPATGTVGASTMLFTHAVGSDAYKQAVTTYRKKIATAVGTSAVSGMSATAGLPAPTLLSQYDGAALNLVTGQFCVVDADARQVQDRVTIMADYSRLVGIARESFSDESWDTLYKHNVSYGEVKSSKCAPEEISEGRCPDGIPTARKDNNWFLYPSDVCAIRAADSPDDTPSGGWCIPSTDNVVYNGGKSLGKVSLECLGREQDHLGFG